MGNCFSNMTEAERQLADQSQGIDELLAQDHLSDSRVIKLLLLGQSFCMDVINSFIHIEVLTTFFFRGGFCFCSGTGDSGTGLIVIQAAVFKILFEYQNRNSFIPWLSMVPLDIKLQARARFSSRCKFYTQRVSHKLNAKLFAWWFAAM